MCKWNSYHNEKMEHFQLPIVSKLADAILKYDMYDRLLVSNVFLTFYLWWEKYLILDKRQPWIKKNTERIYMYTFKL